MLAVFTFSCTKNVNEISFPDFCQADSRFGLLPGEGKPYCGPTATSNVLVYLDKKYPDILDEEEPSKKDQYELIKLLGSKPYMSTHVKEGTEPLGLMKGLEKYIRERGYEISIKWQGWTDGGNYSISKHPNLTWVRDELNNNSNAILQIGWYQYDPKNNFYKRVSGHYVTLIKFNGSNKLVIHDPSVRSGIEEKSEYCKMKRILSGTLSEWDGHPERNARGYIKLEGIKLKENSNAAIIDGVAVFKIRA